MSDLAFEDQLTRLEAIVNALEAGGLRLEESLAVFEEGVALARACSRYLESAERRLEMLVRDESGGVSSAPFMWEPDEER